MVEAQKSSVIKDEPEQETAPVPEARTRTKKRRNIGVTPDPTVPLPEGLDLDEAGPSAFFVKPVGEITGYQDTQEFVVDEEMIKGLPFSKPGANLPKKRLYTIKGIHPDGRLRQFGFESQINNQAGGDPQDAIGLRRYQRKGIIMLLNWETMMPVYCPAWGCFAKADAESYGFCSRRHAVHTLPNMYKDADAIREGMFSSGVTTTRTWEA